MEIATEEIIYEKKPPIAFVTLNRPEKRNALDRGPGTILGTLPEIWHDVRYDPSIRVAVLKGAGKCFCAGYEMSEAGPSRAALAKVDPLELTKGHEDDPWVTFSGKENPEAGPNKEGDPATRAMWDCSKPIIAQVHSFCLGAGLMLANYCDIVIASPDALFAYPPIRFGDPITMSILMPWLLGMRKVNEMAFTGAMINSEEAYNCGLINKIVPLDKLDEEVIKMANVIAAIPPVTNMYTKMVLHHYYEMMNIKSAMDYSHALVMLIEGGNIPGGTKWGFKRRKEIGVTARVEELNLPFREYDAAIRKQARELLEKYK